MSEPTMTDSSESDSKQVVSNSDAAGAEGAKNSQRKEIRAIVPDGSVFDDRKNSYIKYGYFVFILFFVLIGVSATLIQISSAVTATGKVVQTGENKDVQHSKGGPVGEVLVKNGDFVEEGQPVIIIDSEQVESQYQLNHQRMFESHIAIARLNAFVRNDKDFIFSDNEWEEEINKYADIVSTQEALFKAQKASMQANITRLKSRLSGINKEEESLSQQIRTTRAQLDFINESIAEVSELYEEQLVEKSRLTNLKRERVSTLATIDSLNVQIQQLKNAQEDTRKELSQVKQESLENAWLEIENKKAQKLEAQKLLQDLSDQQTRLVINAPASGRVHELTIRNVDAVVSPGEVIMQIVPASEGPTINARIQPIDIEQVYMGQEVRVRLDSFSANTTPELLGEVTRISPDSTLDEQTGEVYFAVTVGLSPEEIAKVTAGEVIPGLPVTVMLTTGKRTIFNYLVKPLTDQLFTAFREE